MRRALLLAVSAALVWAAPGSSKPRGLTYEQAASLAKQILRPQQYANAVLYAEPNPLLHLHGDHLVTPEGPTNFDSMQAAYERDIVTTNEHVITITQPAVWLFWLDADNGAFFPHPSIVLLIDAASGAIVREQEYQWRPLIDTKLPKFLETREAARNPRYIVYSSHPLGAEYRSPTQPTAPSILPTGLLGSDCLVTIGDRNSTGAFGDDVFTGTFSDYAQWAAHVGMRSFPLPAYSDGEDLVARVHQLATTTHPCHNILIVLAGHGSPAPGYFDPNAATSAKPAVRTGLHTFESAGDRVNVRSYYVTSDDIERLLAANRQTTFELVVVSCFSGRFGPELMNWEQEHGLKNLLVVGTDANGKETSHPHVYRGYPSTAPGHVGQFNQAYGIDAVVPMAVEHAAGVPLEENPTESRQDPPEDDYTHDFVDALYKWSDEDFPKGNGHPITFPYAVLTAAEKATRNFQASVLHWVHPDYWFESGTKVTYHYDVRIAVKEAHATWAVNEPTGISRSWSMNSSWELRWPAAAIVVDPWSGTAVLDSTPVGTVTASGTVTGPVPDAQGAPSCSYRDEQELTPKLLADFEPTVLGADAAASEPHVWASYVYTQQLALSWSDAGNVGWTPTWSPTTSGCGLGINLQPLPVNGGLYACQVVLGACPSPAPNRLLAFPISELGTSKILRFSAPLVTTTLLGTPTSSITGTVVTTLTPIGHRIG